MKHFLCALLAPLALLALLANCDAHKITPAKPSPALEAAPQMAIAAPADVQPPCANGQPRNQKNECPAMKPCAKRCSWNRSAPVKQQCWTYLGKNTITGYDQQVDKDGFVCAYTRAYPD